MTSAPIALVGSGEYLPVMREVEAALIAGRPPRYVQLATAAAPEGQKSLDRWHRLGKAQADRLGVEQVVVDVRTRADADDPALATAVAGAGLVYLSGGNPAYLADTLRDTAVLRAIVAAHLGGAALAGCSAGAMALADWAPWHGGSGGVGGHG
ncbi:MAG TPA: Type 1 glutamine amidotransferase-like domain-containing protein, partial [Acidothermaceae bacterium]